MRPIELPDDETRLMDLAPLPRDAHEAARAWRSRIVPFVVAALSLAFVLAYVLIR